MDRGDGRTVTGGGDAVGDGSNVTPIRLCGPNFGRCRSRAGACRAGVSQPACVCECAALVASAWRRGHRCRALATTSVGCSAGRHDRWSDRRQSCRRRGSALVAHIAVASGRGGSSGGRLRAVRAVLLHVRSPRDSASDPAARGRRRPECARRRVCGHRSTGAGRPQCRARPRRPCCGRDPM